MEHETTEQWQPGKVDIDKITKSFTYLQAPDTLSPPEEPQHTRYPPSKSTIKRKAEEVRKATRKLMRAKQRKQGQRAGRPMAVYYLL